MSEAPAPAAPPAFLSGGGALGALIRAFDWSATPLGPTDRWPVPLRTALGILLTSNHPVFIFWGPQATCLYNDAYARSLGPEKHPSILGTPGRLAWPEIWHIIGPQIDQVMAGGEATWHENHLVPILRRGTLENVYWTYSYSPIRDDTAAAGVGGVLVLCTETTGQVLAAKKLEEAESRWRSWFDQAPGFMTILRGPEHVFEFANPTYYELLGRSDIIGRRVRDAAPWAVEQGFIDLLDRVYRSGTAFIARAAPIRIPGRGDPSDAPRYLDFVYQPMRDERGEVTGVFVLGSDVTERKLADQRRDEFLATLAHELRNPLAPIANAVQLLKLARGDAATVGEATDLIDRQLAHLVRLIDDLLDSVRVNRGRIELQTAEVPLGDVVQGALEMAASHLERGAHRLELRLAQERVPLVADRVRLAQVFSNRLINACKYSDAGTPIVVSSEREGDARVLVRVEDRGVGISAQNLERIFEMFSQVGPSINRSQGGLGVGLALARGLVELHGGTLTAYSAGEGEGSVFEVRLPIAPQDRGDASA